MTDSNDSSRIDVFCFNHKRVFFFIDTMSLDLDLDQFNEHNIEIDDGDMMGNNHNQAEKRAHHNALERKRRDHIKGSFNDLRDVIPLLKGEKVKK